MGAPDEQCFLHLPSKPRLSYRAQGPGSREGIESLGPCQILGSALLGHRPALRRRDRKTLCMITSTKQCQLTQALVQNIAKYAHRRLCSAKW
eukprot:COSAG01_NODE_2570_length_7441_cov_2.829202_8_plen_92_part_00